MTEEHSLRQRIEAAFVEQLRTEGHAPLSVFRFCQKLGISEREFFHEFSTLESVERHWWKAFLEQVIQSVESGSEWADFSARQRMVAFLFALVTASLDQRGLLLLRLGNKSPLQNVPEWTALEERYDEFARSLLMHGRSRGEILSRGPLGLAYPRALRVLMRSVMAFHVKDESHRFERTDVFVEKTATVFFDLMGRQVLDSGLDWLRFVLPGTLRRG